MGWVRAEGDLNAMVLVAFFLSLNKWRGGTKAEGDLNTVVLVAFLLQLTDMMGCVYS